MNPFDEIRTVKFTDKQTGELLAEKVFFADDITVIHPNGEATGMTTGSFMEQEFKFKQELSRNLNIPLDQIKSEAL